MTEDQKIVAALNKEYQAAVERNDAGTMGRILADDVVLIGGRGKVFTFGSGAAADRVYCRVSDGLEVAQDVGLPKAEDRPA